MVDPAASLTTDFSWSGVYAWKPFTRPFEWAHIHAWTPTIAFVVKVWTNAPGGTSRDKNNKISATTASPLKIRHIIFGKLRIRPISLPTPDQVWCYRAKTPLRICLFVSHITCKHTLFIFFAQIIITSSIHNTFVHVKTFLVMPSTNATTIVVRTPFQFEPMFVFWVFPHKIKSACCQFQRINNGDCDVEYIE